MTHPVTTTSTSEPASGIVTIGPTTQPFGRPRWRKCASDRSRKGSSHSRAVQPPVRPAWRQKVPGRTTTTWPWMSIRVIQTRSVKLKKVKAATAWMWRGSPRKLKVGDRHHTRSLSTDTSCFPGHRCSMDLGLLRPKVTIRTVPRIFGNKLWDHRPRLIALRPGVVKTAIVACRRRLPMPRLLFSHARWGSGARVSGSRRRRRGGSGAVLDVGKEFATCVRLRGKEGSVLAA